MPESQKLFKEPEPVKEPEPEPEEFTHYVHLADGRTVKVNHNGHEGTYPHVYVEGKKHTLVVGVYPRLDDEE